MLLPQKIFITGTDTNIGKTYVATQLLHQYHQQGLSTIGIKPVASGCEWRNGKLINEDALALLTASSIKLPYELINPIQFEPAIAPHIAATLTHTPLSVDMINQNLQPALTHAADIHLIEGCGGWLCPLNETETMADVVVTNQWDVILVVGMRLGCLNHALLTYESIMRSGARLIGWIANRIDPRMDYCEENIGTLENRIHAPRISFNDKNGHHADAPHKD